MRIKFDKFKFTTVNAAKCVTTGCNNNPYHSGGIYCYYCMVKQGMPVD